MGIAQRYMAKPYGALLLDELEDYHAIISGFSEFIANDVSPGITHHNRALAYWEIGQTDNALLDFEAAEKKLPNSHMPPQIKGMLLQKLGRLGDAIESLDRAVERGPNEPTVRRARALMLVEAGRLEEALHDFNYAIKLVPSFKRTKEDRDSVLARLNEMRLQNSPKKWWQLWRE